MKDTPRRDRESKDSRDMVGGRHFKVVEGQDTAGMGQGSPNGDGERSGGT